MMNGCHISVVHIRGMLIDMYENQCTGSMVHVCLLRVYWTLWQSNFHTQVYASSSFFQVKVRRKYPNTKLVRLMEQNSLSVKNVQRIPKINFEWQYN